MKDFFYKARDTQGNLTSGVITSNSLEDAIAILSSKNLIVIDIKEVKEKKVKVKKEAAKKVVLKRGISLLDLAVFFRQTATMVNASVPILDAISDLSKVTTSAGLKKILEDIATNISKGESFSSSLKKHPKVFSELIISMIQAGEESGKLAEILKRLAKYLEEQVKLKGKIQSALTYPAVIFVFFSLVLCVILFFIVPKFENMYKSFGANLPYFTQVIVNISRFLASNIIFFIFLIFILISLFGYLYRTQKTFRYFVDDIKLKLPIFGNLFTKIVFERFCSTLSTLVSSGVSIVSSLDIVSQVVGLLPIQENLQEIKIEVLKGSSLSTEMDKHIFFPKMLVRMVKIGEATGNISEMLNNVGEFYKEEVDNIISSLTSILEPVMIIFMGIIIGIVVVALYLPIFKLASLMGR